ncbi:MAG TPA: phenylpyruvate tautomerase MIF-related protein [Bacteroidales bacterium]|nr:phenylpyruvate tautomerase MIF-related protein [Bacteroidales bacterium]
MPYLKIKTNQKLNAGDELIANLSKLVAEMLHKPEKYVMIDVEDQRQMLFGGTDAPLIYCELKSIGLPREQTSDLSARLTGFLTEATHVPANRIYIEFVDAPRDLWGWNGGIF